jgi:hypothetical protein
MPDHKLIELTVKFKPKALSSNGIEPESLRLFFKGINIHKDLKAGVLSIKYRGP